MVASQLTKVCVDCMKNACWKIFKKTGPFVCEKRMFGPYLIKNQCALTKKAKFRDRQIDARIGTKSREIFVSETRDTGIHIWSTHLQNAHWPKNSVNHLSVNMKSSAFSEGWPKVHSVHPKFGQSSTNVQNHDYPSQKSEWVFKIIVTRFI